jgi:hypothetical protein
MQATESSVRNNTTPSRRTNSASRCFLAQSEVGAVIVIIADVLGKQSLQVVLVQSNDMVEEVPPTASDPALCNAILPRALEGGLDARHVHGTNGRGNFQPELLVMIEKEELGGGLIWKSFPQLLDDPTTGGMPSDIELEDAPTIMADDKEAIEYVESKSGNGEEIHRSYGFAMITKKSHPSLRRFRISGGPAHPSGDGSFRNGEAQHA